MRWFKRHIYTPAKQTFFQFGMDDGSLLAAGVAYYVGLSFFPLLLVLVSGLSLFLKYTHLGQDAQSRVLDAVASNFSRETATQVGQVFDQLGDDAGFSGPIGLVILLVTAGTIFAQFERAFDRIWHFTPPEDLGWRETIQSILIDRLVAFVLLIAVALLIAITFIAGLALTSIRTYVDQVSQLPAPVWTTLQVLTTVTINTFAFGVLYHTLPRAPVRWPEAFRGGMVVSIVWEVGRQLLAAFLIGGRYGTYGVVGAFIAIQLWAYYAMTVILLGAEYVRVTCKNCSGEAAAAMNRRRFWQLMSKAVARKRSDSKDSGSKKPDREKSDSKESESQSPDSKPPDSKPPSVPPTATKPHHQIVAKSKINAAK